jgi:uncharacterized coiled-coil protein SlyX
MDAIDILAGSGGASAVLFGLGYFIRQVGNHWPGVIDALRRWTESHRSTAATVESFRRELFSRVERLEREHGDCQRGLRTASVRIEQLEEQVATQALTISHLRELVEIRETQARALMDELAVLHRSIDGGGKAEGRALPEPFQPEHGRDDTGSHRIPKASR